MKKPLGKGKLTDRVTVLIALARFTALVGFAFMLTMNVSKGDEICSQAESALVKNSLQCRLEVISWVEVGIQGELLEGHKRDYERLVRLRLRNDLSMMINETVRYLDALEDYGYNPESPELMKRGAVGCFVWTVGDEYPVAFLVECKLWGYGKYSLYPDEFTGRMLGYSNSTKVDEQVRSAIRELIADISAELLEARDRANQ